LPRIGIGRHELDEPIEHRLILSERVRFLERLDGFEIFFHGSVERCLPRLLVVRRFDAERPPFELVLLAPDGLQDFGRGRPGCMFPAFPPLPEIEIIPPVREGVPIERAGFLARDGYDLPPAFNFDLLENTDTRHTSLLTVYIPQF